MCLYRRKDAGSIYFVVLLTCLYRRKDAGSIYFVVIPIGCLSECFITDLFVCAQDPEKKMKEEQDEEDRKKREEEEKKRKEEEGECGG